MRVVLTGVHDKETARRTARDSPGGPVGQAPRSQHRGPGSFPA